jgi:mucin-19
MSVNNTRKNVAYGLSDALLNVFPAPILSNRDPNPNDKADIGQMWVNTLDSGVFVLASIISNHATWASITGDGTITTVTTDAGNAVPAAGVIDIAGGLNMNTSGAGNTVSINLDASPSVTGSLTAATGITTTGGNILASAGTVTGHTGVIATTGNIVATAGEVNAGTTMTAGTGLTVSNFTAGVVQSSAAGIFSSSNGTNGQVLIGGGATPVWANLTAGANVTITNGAGTITIASGTGADAVAYTAVNTTPYVVLATDYYLGVNSTAATRQVNLPNAPATGRIFVVKDSLGQSATHNITITTVGGTVTIDGATTLVLATNFESVQLIFNGTSYEVY